MERSLDLVVIVAFLIFLYTSCMGKPVPSEKKEDPAKAAEADYLRYLGQVVEIMEQDEAFKNKLHNASEKDIRSGKITEDFDLISHKVRSKLDELKRKEIEFQHQLLRKQNDNMNGIERQYWHPVHDENQVSFEAEDFAKLLHKHNEMMEEHDKKRRGEFKDYELKKEHKRRAELKKLNEKERKQKEEGHTEEVQKQRKHEKMHEPGSKAELEEVWKEEDGLDPDSFDPKTFFKLHDKNGDNYLDAYELETFFLGDIEKVYNESDPTVDPKERDEEMERMREHVLKEMDKNKDGLVSLDEFIKQTKDPNFEKDEGYEPIVDKEQYTENELTDFEAQLEREIQYGTNEDHHEQENDKDDKDDHHEQREEHHDNKGEEHHEKEEEHHDNKKEEHHENKQEVHHEKQAEHHEQQQKSEHADPPRQPPH